MCPPLTERAGRNSQRFHAKSVMDVYTCCLPSHSFVPPSIGLQEESCIHLDGFLFPSTQGPPACFSLISSSLHSFNKQTEQIFVMRIDHW